MRCRKPNHHAAASHPFGSGSEIPCLTRLIKLITRPALESFQEFIERDERCRESPPAPQYVWTFGTWYGHCDPPRLSTQVYQQHTLTHDTAQIFHPRHTPSQAMIALAFRSFAVPPRTRPHERSCAHAIRDLRSAGPLTRARDALGHRRGHDCYQLLRGRRLAAATHQHSSRPRRPLSCWLHLR